jgi:hypothetical protein
MSTQTPQAIPLAQAIDAPDLHWTKFFNGRLLTGADLDGEQRSNRAARMLLGQALGAGVVCGFDVELVRGSSSPTQPVLTVSCGLAVNRLGEALELATDATIALSAGAAGDAGPDTGFTVCQPGTPGSYTTATGVFVLTVCSASSSHGRAPVSGLGNGGASCNVDYDADGVQFQLVALAIDATLGEHPDLLRNRVAHLMFGTTDPARVSELVDPFAHGSSRYGLLDYLPTDCIGPDCVPLAVLHWDTTGVTFVDRWAVRRGIVAAIVADRWPTLTGDRRRAEADAMFLQFEDQIEELLPTLTSPQTAVASTSFAYLPPAGLLPINTPGGAPGFDPATFFGAQASRDIAEIDAALIRALVHESFWHEPIEVGSAERIQLYVIRENEAAVASGAADQAALLFAKHTLPYRGIARFGKARFERSRFAPRVI